jgi:predicted phosphodiesterase
VALPTTLVISDLHLGRTDRRDLLRRPDLREPLLEALRQADRLVILGDGLELREAAHRDALASAGDFFRDVGRAVGEIVMLAGNHDHGIAAGWIDGRLQSEPAGFLGLEERYGPTGALTRRLVEAARPARLEFAYPGIWLRDDVYAFHGHYSDLHATVPTFERVAAGAMARWVARQPGHDATPDDYEAVLSPLYAWLHALTQRADHTLVSKGGGASSGAYAALTRRGARALVLNVGYRGAVATLNGLGLGPLQASLSPTALRRGYLHGIKEVVTRLNIGADFVIWGHSHRSGPWPTDDASEWAGIVNTGSWVYQRHFLSPEPNGSPYWPGTAVRVTDSGPPELLRLLGDRGHDELRPSQV